MKKIWLIDAGHGGMIGGKYMTAPAKMFRHNDFTIFEGVINRAIAGHLAKLLKAAEIEFHFLHDDIADTPLKIRCERANAISKGKQCVMLSIHSNAGGGKGFEVWTSKGQTAADPIAEVFSRSFKKHFPEFPFRADVADGDMDKESDFYVLIHTIAPAVLVENLFFDNIDEAKFLMTAQGQIRIAMSLYESILNIHNEKNL
jgi:N-acetylmuramoyl-L-alanine amidase